METGLDHLPEGKRQDLAWALKVLFEEFEAAVAHGSSGYRRNAAILKVILFGSYATDAWVEDPVGGYFSDYDILVVVNHPKLTDVLDYWAKADARLGRDYLVTKRLSAPVNFIVHDLADVNEQLRRGRYFFRDVVRDGMELYSAAGVGFEAPAVLRAEEALKEARGYFEEWSRSAEKFKRSGEFLISDGAPKEAAFSLHQAVERLYTCVLLVKTLYSPKSHRLNFLRSQAEQLDGRLAEAWPRASRFEQRCFELLRRAYVEARYSSHYKITEKELAWLLARVGALQGLVEAVCRERLAELAVEVKD
jgi:predicted nucleotidyltransferase/HEPN domain-containing protein